MLHYRQTLVPPGLAEHIECFWTLSGRLTNVPRAPHRILPDGSMEIVLNFGDRFQRRTENGRERQPALMLVGQMHSAVVVEPGDVVDLVGIRFLPAGAYPFLRVSMHELTGRMEPLDAIATWLTPHFDDLQALSPQARIQSLSTLLIARLRRSAPKDVRVHAAVGHVLRSKGQLSMDKLSRDCAISTRQLERRFKAEVGLSPKMLGRILRFQAVFQAAEANPATWADVALECGYYDQAHLVRDFREFAGEVPSRLFAEPDWLMQAFLRKQQMSNFSKTS